MSATAAPIAPPVGLTSVTDSRRRRTTLGAFASRRTALAAALVLVVVTALAIAAPLIQIHDPLATDLRNRQAQPSATHILGTDTLGRDVWSRIVWGGRASLPVGAVVVLVSLTSGGLLGTLGGYFGRKVDLAIVFLVNVLLTLPGLLLAIALVAALGAGLGQVILAIGIGQAPRFARLQRSVVLGLRERDYVLAARAIGASHRRIMLRYILPNSLAPLIVLASLSAAQAIVVEASLSFLGLGLPPPNPSWGGMLADARSALRTAPWVAVFPGLVIMLVALACNVLGDAVRDATDPRLK